MLEITLGHIATFGALATAVVALATPYRTAVWALFVLAIVLGLVAGVLSVLALAPLSALIAAVYAVERWPGIVGARRKTLLIRISAGVVTVILVLALALHVLPGFANPRLLSQVVFSPGAAPYTLYLNFDKTAAGVVLLAFGTTALASRAAWAQMGRGMAPYALAAVVIVVGLAWASRYIAFVPKLTPWFVPWALVNLLFVCMAEEAFFRNFVQRQLARVIGGARGGIIALGITAPLFGIAHAGGGPVLVALATVAGLGYGYVYLRTGRVEASILTHFAVNAVHFLLFTYPYAVTV